MIIEVGHTGQCISRNRHTRLSMLGVWTQGAPDQRDGATYQRAAYVNSAAGRASHWVMRIARRIPMAKRAVLIPVDCF